MKRAGRAALMLIFAVLSFWFAWQFFKDDPAPPVAAPEPMEPVVPEPRTPPLDFSGFQPGNIISDQEFYDSSAMTAGEVASFIDEVNSGCREGWEGTPCLANYREDAPVFEADDYCFAFEGEADESAASIIHRAAESCGINPRALLVMLQKEQGLLTASGPRLNQTRYEIAMGYGCPDTANCDPAYFGFGKQAYYAARQLRRYANEPGEYGVLPGQTNTIRYHPNESCGASDVHVENFATAGLYNYTPYQPDGAALEGNPGACSGVGNLNFYAYYNAWFPDQAD